jgi:hypothetical protein
MEVSGQPHDPAVLLPGNKSPNPFNRRLGGSQSGSTGLADEKYLLPLEGIENVSSVVLTTNLDYHDSSVVPAINLYQEQ